MRFVILVCCLVLGGMSLSGQTFSAALVAGGNLSQIDGDKLVGFHQLGLNTGARVAARFSDRWSMSLEMLYSQQGARRVRNDDPSSIYDDIRLNFVEAPVMINFSDWKILASAGVSYARLINFQTIDIAGEDITDLEDYNPGIFSIVLGGTFLIGEDWGLNIRWSKYLNNLRMDDNVDAEPFIGRNVGVRLYYFL